MNCEEEMREKNEMGGGMCVSGGGEEKRSARGYMGGGEKKKKMGSKVYGYGGKKWGSGKERRKKI